MIDHGMRFQTISILEGGKADMLTRKTLSVASRLLLPPTYSFIITIRHKLSSQEKYTASESGSKYLSVNVTIVRTVQQIYSQRYV